MCVHHRACKSLNVCDCQFSLTTMCITVIELQSSSLVATTYEMSHLQQKETYRYISQTENVNHKQRQTRALKGMRNQEVNVSS